jgi:hypothetical protein
VIGVDEHRWAPRRRGAEGFVTLIIDLTPTYERTGPARLLDLVQGRSATALASWLAAAPADFAQAVEVIAMDGFAGYKTAATEVVPDAVTVMDPFHVVALAKLDLIRQRIQQHTLGRRGHTGDPLYGIRRIARTRLQPGILTEPLTPRTHVTGIFSSGPNSGHDIVAELLRTGPCHDNLVPARPPWATHLRCHLFVRAAEPFSSGQVVMSPVSTHSSVPRFRNDPDANCSVSFNLPPGDLTLTPEPAAISVCPAPS